MASTVQYSTVQYTVQCVSGDLALSPAGTYILVLLGAASIAQSVLSLGHKGDFFSINWG